MIKIGCCANMVAKEPGGLGIEIIDNIDIMRYDYIELSLSHVAGMDEDEFSVLLEKISSSRIPCEACNNFFPKNIRLTGDKADLKVTLSYVEHALSRAARLGASIVVFGSSEAKNVPDGFSGEKAWDQIVKLLKEIDEIAGRYGITIVIEALNRIESNLINTVKEGYNLVKDVNRSNIRLLIDYYHMMVEKEDLRIIIEAGEYIKHVHIARLLGRSYLLTGNECNYNTFFYNLKKIKYEGRISIEGYTQDFLNDAEKALNFIRQNVN